MKTNLYCNSTIRDTPTKGFGRGRSCVCMRMCTVCTVCTQPGSSMWKPTGPIDPPAAHRLATFGVSRACYTWPAPEGKCQSKRLSNEVHLSACSVPPQLSHAMMLKLKALFAGHGSMGGRGGGVWVVLRVASLPARRQSRLLVLYSRPGCATSTAPLTELSWKSHVTLCCTNAAHFRERSCNESAARPCNLDQQLTFTPRRHGDDTQYTPCTHSLHSSTSLTTNQG